MAKQSNKKAAAVAVVTFPKTEANRKARLARHLRKHPNDNQAANAPAEAPRRKKPTGKAQRPVFSGAGNAADKQELKEIMKATQGRFGHVRPNIFGCEYSRENVRALCYGVGIKFTGAANKPRRQPAKRKAK